MTHDPNDATLEPSSPKPQDALLHQLQALVPEAFSESRLDVAALKRALGEESVIEGGERYALTWAGKANAYKVLQTPSAIPNCRHGGWSCFAECHSPCT